MPEPEAESGSGIAHSPMSVGRRLGHALVVAVTETSLTRTTRAWFPKNPHAPSTKGDPDDRDDASPGPRGRSGASRRRLPRCIPFVAFGTRGLWSPPLRQRTRASHQRVSAERQHPGRRPGIHGNGHDDQAAHPAPRNEEDVTPTSNLDTEAAGFRTRRPFSFFRLRHDQQQQQPTRPHSQHRRQGTDR